MLRKAGFVCALMLSLPTFANAWTLTAKIGSGLGTITSDKAVATVNKSGSAPVIGYFKTATNVGGDLTQTITVTPDATCDVSSVIIDGVNKTVAGATTYAVSAGAPVKNHSVVVYYTAKTLGVTVTQAAGGSVSIQNLDASGKPFGSISRTGFTGLKAGAKVRVYASPNSDYAVAAGNGFTAGLQGDAQYQDITLAGATSVTASFTQVPQVAARLAASSLSVAAGSTVTLDASKSSANGAITYAFSGSGATFAPYSTTKARATFANPGTYVVTVTATNGTATSQSSATVVVIPPGSYAIGSAACTSCHATRNAAIVASYNAANHRNSSHSTCDSCHNASNANHPGNVNSLTVSPLTFKTMTTNIGGLPATGAFFCVKCHQQGKYGDTSWEYATSGHGTNSHGPKCGSCHTNLHNPETAINACIGCHNGGYDQNFGGVQHFTNYTTSTFHNISAAYVGYGQGGGHLGDYAHSKGKGINLCVGCHFTIDPHGIGAATPTNPTGEDTFKQNSDVLAAWAESGHGARTGAAWIPSSSHDWRNSGSTANFQTTVPASDCLRCHTAAGFAQFVDSKFTNVNNVGAADGQRFNSPLACYACHAPDGDGRTTADRRAAVVTPAAAYGNGKTYTSYPAPVANVGVGVASFYNISTGKYNVPKGAPKAPTVKVRIAANFPDVGESNLCNSCHSGRLSGAALVQAAANGLDLTNSGFQNSHYMAASGLMYAKAGFTAFTSATAAIGTSTYGKSLTSSLDMSGGVSSTHRNLGTPAIVGDHGVTAGTMDSQGPCVTCHMQATKPGTKVLRAGAGHSLEINADAYAQVCILCHTSEGSATGPVALTAANFVANFVEPNAEAFQKSLALATTILRTKYGIKYDSSAYPYFYDMTKDATGKTSVTDWTRGNTLTAAAALKLEGACFNINLLSREPAAFVHARSYTRRLVYDSIDFLDDGIINKSVATTAHNVDPTNFTAGTTAYTDSTLGTFATGTTEGMLYLKAWTRGDGTWAAIERP